VTLTATVPDLLRLVAVPVFAWAAVRDVRTRRISSSLWVPLAALGAILLVWDGWLARRSGEFAWAEFLLPAAVSLGFVVPLAYLFWWFGGFGGADAKALMTLAVLFPIAPAYAVGGVVFPLTVTPIGAFSFTILTNAVLVGLAIPVVLAARNAAAGRIAPVMFVGWPVDVEAIPDRHGRLLGERGGLDLDALRMYLRWRGLAFDRLRAEPDRYRDPATLPADPNPPTDGAVDVAAELESGGDGRDDAIERRDGLEDDPWGAETFLAEIDRSAYGTTAEELREGLEVLVAEDRVWISPGTPFLVPVFFGLLVALVYGDLLLSVLG